MVGGPYDVLLTEVDGPMDAAEVAEVLAFAEAQIQANREFLLKDSISAEEAAALIDRSLEMIEQARRANRLLALQSGGQWQYPRWQFEPGAPEGVVPGLEEVIQRLHLSSAGVAFWLLKPAERLGGVPPLELLRRHDPEPVIQLAWEQSFVP